ncbi:hypothetical protein HNR42_002103 [Deinobacterium chartae]|uniref:DUF2154 domain-containing protein n=1 Tax=Deinobacterium chartae TaxID=521158 RepID=A0A841I2U5_9DEIO|nr:hypothetical protein [Deinobacterium chartae]MBB6098668.1 hypothetical protein [Deinobacterium chartae]
MNITFRTAALAAALSLTALAASSRLERLAYPLDGASRAEVHLQTGVALLELGALESSSLLLRGDLEVPIRARIKSELRRTGEQVMVSLQEDKRLNLNLFKSGPDSHWRIWLNPKTLTRLVVRSGVGEMRLNLRQLRLSALTVQSGVGETVVTLPAQGRLKATIQAGVGALTVRVPRGMAADIRAVAGSGAVTVHGNYQRSGDRYRSPHYARSPHRVDLTLEGGIGEIVVEPLGD